MKYKLCYRIASKTSDIAKKRGFNLIVIWESDINVMSDIDIDQNLLKSIIK